MPFQRYARYFGPDELDALTMAFNSAWRELSASGIDLSNEQKAESVKRRLARRLLVTAAMSDARDIHNLRNEALKNWPSLNAPFENYASFFGPEELDTLTAAYESAWQELFATGIALDPDQAVLVKRKLVRVILATACTGDRSVERLKDAAIRALSVKRLAEVLAEEE
jgi:hypothetical protein